MIFTYPTEFHLIKVMPKIKGLAPEMLKALENGWKGHKLLIDLTRAQ